MSLSNAGDTGIILRDRNQCLGLRLHSQTGLADALLLASPPCEGVG
jgi:hypothetical protein